MGTAEKRLIVGLVAIFGACLVAYFHPYKVMAVAIVCIYYIYGISSIAYFYRLVMRKSSTFAHDVLRATMIASYIIVAFIMIAGFLGVSVELIKIIKDMDTVETSIDRSLMRIYTWGNLILICLPVMLEKSIFDRSGQGKNKSETTAQQP